MTVGAILGLLGSTPVLHWLGSRRAIAAALLLITAALAVMGLALIMASVPLVAVAFVIVGLGIGTLDVLINVEGAAVERAAGRTLMPMMHAAWSIGVAAGAGIGAACAALGVSPAAQLIAEAVLIAAAALATAAGIPGGSRGPAGEPPRDRGARLRQWLRGWLDVRLLLIGVVMLGVELGEGSAGNWLTLAVRNGHGQAAAVAALFAAAFAASEAITRIFGGPIVDRLGRVRTIRVTTALGVVGVVLFILAGNPWIVLVGVLLWAVGVSMGFPLGMSAAAESGPDPAAGSASSPPSATSPTWPDRPPSACSPSPRASSTPCGSSSRCSSPPSPRPARSARARTPLNQQPPLAPRPGRRACRTMPKLAEAAGAEARITLPKGGSHAG